MKDHGKRGCWEHPLGETSKRGQRFFVLASYCTTNACEFQHQFANRLPALEVGHD